MPVDQEWYMETPFGKVALISWGERLLPPVLLVHGFGDSAATFIPLVRHLPDTHYYVSFDFPGHGKSDPVSSGLPVSQTIMLEIIRRIVNHMQWATFVYVAHSLGCTTGLFYHHIFPGKIKKIINLDPSHSLSRHHFMTRSISTWYKTFYERYYDTYKKDNVQFTLLTYDQALQTVMESRSLTQAQAELILSRNLVQVEPTLYRLYNNQHLSKMVNFPVFDDSMEYIFNSNNLPTLNIHASESKEKYQSIKFSSYWSKICSFDDPTLKHIVNVCVPGPHDVHFTNPEKLVPYITKFLAEDDGGIASKL